MRSRHFFIYLMIILISGACASSKKARIRENKVKTIISTARSYIGTPYRWGGTSRAGMDCSGLLCNSFESINYDLPRTSEAQSKVGSKVKPKDLQPGDLVFFATGKKKRRITHVGLVTEVRGQSVKFIHSSSSLGVVESDMNSNYYKKRFRLARRPF